MVPPDLAAALAAEPAAQATFDRLSYSDKSWYVRERRVGKSVAMLSLGRGR